MRSVIATTLRAGLTALLCLALAWQVHALAKSMGFSKALLAHAFERDAGQAESLPPEILEAVRLVRSHRRTVSPGLRLAPVIAADSLLMQRAVEALYPVRIADDATVLLARGGDESVARCQVVDQSNRVGLFECARRE